MELDLHVKTHKQVEWEQMTPTQKKKQLFLNQKELLDKFLERHAISQAQYQKSLGDLRLKMGFPEAKQ